MQKKLNISLPLIPENRIGTGGGQVDTAPADIKLLTMAAEKAGLLDSKQYEVISFQRTSPKPGTHYLFELKCKVLNPDAEQVADMTRLSAILDRMSEKEYMRYQRIISGADVSDKQYSDNILRALAIREESKHQD